MIVKKDTDKPHLNMTLPHLYQSEKEKTTCGEYSIIIRKLNIALNKYKSNDFYFEP
jgi:glutathionyl-hydroquinone reductase